jgi:hypothetical protein
VWASAEFVYLPRLWAQQAALWSVRMYLASGLLLFDNLCVLWWYADSTKQLVRKAEEQQGTLETQLHVMQAQLAQAQEEYRESQRRLLVSQKPDVYIERVEDPERRNQQGRVIDYIVRNAGGGPAVNIYYSGLFELAFGGPISIGALAGGDMRRLPADTNHVLQDGHGGVKYVLIAEADYTRTTQWTTTLTIRTHTAGRHRGQVLYRTAEPEIQPPRFKYQSLSDYWANNHQCFAEQLLAFAREETE